MKRLGTLITILLTVYCILSTANFVDAVTILSPVSGDFVSNFNRVTGVIRPITVFSFTGVFLWGGFTWMKAGDSSDEVEKAQKILLAGIIGLIIIFIAPSIVQFIGMIFGVQNLIDFTP